MPESVETRLARVEATQTAHGAQLGRLDPLSDKYARVDERLKSLRTDLNNGLQVIRDELDEIKADQLARARERRTMLVALFVAGIGLFGTFVATAVPLLKSPDPAPIVRER